MSEPRRPERFGPVRATTQDHPRIWAAARTGGTSLRMTRAVLEMIRSTVGRRPVETGGMLGGSRIDGVVRLFEFDEAAAATSVTYSPSHRMLTALLREQWNPRGDQLLGFVHSHPGGFRRPSGPDVEYAQRFLTLNPDLDEMLVPIVSSGARGGEFGITAYAVRRGERGARKLDLLVVDDPRPPRRRSSAFERAEGAYDLDRMARSRVVVVGVGGASQYVEDLCRAGIGEVVLVDPDRIERRNVATQQVCLRDVGELKVDAAARRLVDVSPSVAVVTVPTSTDALGDADFERLATARIAGRPRPDVTLLGGFTDSFWAQARTARVALNLGLPSIAAQVYAEGRGVEVTFALPGVTPACQRCALGSRYRAYLDGGYRNTVGSGGTPIFATTRLNALKGMVTLALLHAAGPAPAAGAGARRWLRLMDRISNRNLVLTRISPDLAELGLTAFDSALAGADQNRIVTDETLWLPQEPENPETGFAPCGDCGGTGNLLDAVGTLGDTILPVRTVA